MLRHFRRSYSDFAYQLLNRQKQRMRFNLQRRIQFLHVVRREHDQSFSSARRPESVYEVQKPRKRHFARVCIANFSHHHFLHRILLDLRFPSLSGEIQRTIDVLDYDDGLA